MYDGEGKGEGVAKIRVHYYSFCTTTERLLPSWVLPKDLLAVAPKEKLQVGKPRNHVANEEAIDVERVVLAGAAATLNTSGLPTDEQHKALRFFCKLRANVECFPWMSWLRA